MASHQSTGGKVSSRALSCESKIADGQSEEGKTSHIRAPSCESRIAGGQDGEGRISQRGTVN